MNPTRLGPRWGVAYRESSESCPRCRVLLEDAGAVRACRRCNGQWVHEQALAEMLLVMLPAVVQQPSLVARASREAPRPCPSCGVAMEPVGLHDVELERCAKGHGVWFDPEELQTGLLRYAERPPQPGVSTVEEPWTLGGRPSEPPVPIDLLPKPPATNEPPKPPPPVAKAVPAWVSALPPDAPLAKVIARMQAGKIFSVGGNRCYDEYGWDADTQQPYHYSRDEDAQYEGRSYLTKEQLAGVLTSLGELSE